jgi:MFS family permease
MKQLKARHIMLIAALCGMMSNCLGILFNVAGLYFNPIAADFAIGRGDVSMAHTIASLGCAVGGVTGAWIAKKLKFRPIVLICAIVFAGATALLAFTHSIWPMYILSVFRGVAAGTAGTVLVTIVINNWFTGKVGLMTSLIFCSAGISGAILSPILSGIIEKMGWRAGYLAMAAFIVLFYLPALLFPLETRPEDAGYEVLVLGEKNAPLQPQTEGPARPLRIDPALYALILLYACIASASTAYIPHFSGIADSYGQTAAVGSAMVSASMLANTFGKLVYGWMTDRIGIRKSVWIYGMLVILGIALLLKVHSGAALYAAAFLIGMCYSLSSVGVALLSRDLFGTAVHAKAYPSINMLNTFANAGLTSVIGFMYDAFGNYNGALLLFLGGEIVLMVTTLLAYKRAASIQ